MNYPRNRNNRPWAHDHFGHCAAHGGFERATRALRDALVCRVDSFRLRRGRAVVYMTRADRLNNLRLRLR